MFFSVLISAFVPIALLYNTWYGYLIQFGVVGLGFVLGHYLPERKSKIIVRSLSVLVIVVLFSVILREPECFGFCLTTKTHLLFITPTVVGFITFIDLIVGQFIGSATK